LNNTEPSGLPEILVPMEMDPQVVIIQDVQDSPDDPGCKRFYVISGSTEGFFDLPAEYVERFPPGSQLVVRSSQMPNMN
jgi:hypothetical protein